VGLGSLGSAASHLGEDRYGPVGGGAGWSQTAEVQATVTLPVLPALPNVTCAPTLPF
jgi:hypothetical protein